MKTPIIKIENNEIKIDGNFKFEKEYAVTNPELKEGNILRLAFDFSTMIDSDVNQAPDVTKLNEKIADKLKEDFLNFLNEMKSNAKH